MKRKSQEKGRTIGIYPETKHPTYHRSLGLRLESRLVRRFDFFVTDEGLREIKTYADGIGPWKRYIVSTRAADLNGDGQIRDENGDRLVNEADRALVPAADLVSRAHRHGLVVHTWTFRNEQRRLAADYSGNPANEYLQFYRLGIDGVFADFPDTAIAARAVFRLQAEPAFAECLIGGPSSHRRADCAAGDD